MSGFSTYFCAAVSAFFLISDSAFAATLVADDFNDGVFDAAKWNASLPLPEASFEESGGSLILRNRAVISTVDQIAFPLTITGALMASDFDIVRVLTRSDLQVEDAYYHELHGLRFSFHYDSDTIQIQDSNHVTVAQKPYSFSVGEWYDFKITDDGTNVSWSINGIEELGGISNYAGGSYVSYYNRHVNLGWVIPSTASFDYFSIASSPVPEPKSTLLPIVSFAAIFVGRRNRRYTHGVQAPSLNGPPLRSHSLLHKNTAAPCVRIVVQAAQL